jgi:tetratricopeptide (TPR) repeat protein
VLVVRRPVALALRSSVLALALGAIGAGGVPTAKYELGLASMYQLDRLTIIYPSRPAERAETARRSAESRAEFLRRVHGVDARVVSDAAATGPHLSSDLLLLGWDNGLLGGRRAPVPFARSENGGLTFEDGPSFPADTDLGFVYPSPYNSTRLLYFWSRIDPEIDRFQVLPFEGSQWVVYRRFLPIAQGMWEDGDDWPPRRDPRAEIDHGDTLRDRQAALGVVRRGTYDIRFAQGDVDTDTVDRIGAARNASLAAAAEALRMTVPEDYRVRLFLYPDETAKLAATGITAAIHSVPRDRELHMVARYAEVRNPHEEIHLLAAERFGPCRSTGLYEGLSIALEKSWGPHGLAFHGARMLDDEDGLPPIADLLSEGGMRALREDRALPAAALLVQWILDRGGDEAFGGLYARDWPDPASVAAAVGVPPDQVDAAFRAWVRSTSRPADRDLEAVKLLEEARQRHLDADYPGLVEVLEKILEIRPGEPQTLFNLASAQMRTGSYAAAERNLRAILDGGLPDDDPLVVFGHYQLGRLYDIQGRRDDAVREYRRVLELPDVRDSHRSATEALEAPFTPDRLE